MVGGGFIIPYAEYESVEVMKRAAEVLRNLIPRGINKELAYTFIGNTKLTGDSFGPMAGSIVSSYISSLGSTSKVFGTMDEPITTFNINKYRNGIIDNYYTIAIGSTYSPYNESSILIHKGGYKLGKENKYIGDIVILYRLANCHTVRDLDNYNEKRVQRATTFITWVIYFLELELNKRGGL